MTDQEFLKAYKISTRRFADVMRQWLPKSLLSGAEGNHAKYVIQMAANRAKAEFNQAAKSWVKQAIPESARQGTVYAEKWLGSLAKKSAGGFTPKTGSTRFGGVNDRLVARLMKDTVAKLAKVADSAPRLAVDNLRVAKKVLAKDAAISRSLAEGLLDKPTMKRLADRVLNATGLSKGDPVVYSNGAVWDASDYAKMTARTRTMEAQNTGFEAQLKSMGEVYVYYPKHTGVKEYDICFALQGKVWALSSNNSLGLPTLASVGREPPPWHPNCSHTPSPWVLELRSQGEIDDAVAAHDSDADDLAQVTN